MAFANDYQKRQPSVCLQCRQIFPSNNQLHRHIKNDCWATESEHQYPEEWTPDLKDYVRRALDPANSEPGWASSEIVEELKQMIYFGHILDPAIGPRWKTMKLPQHIDPADLPYDRKPRHRIQESPVPSPPSTPLPTKTYPELFHAPHSTPQSLFKHKDGAHFVAHRDYREVLLFADGACTNNGQEGAQGGCAFVTHCSDSRPTPWHPPKGAYFMHGMFFFRLEDVGPTGKTWRPTSNRAELRAVIAALQFRDWSMDCNRSWRSLVIATDSEYGRCSQSTDSLPVCRELSLLSRHVSRLNNS